MKRWFFVVIIFAMSFVAARPQATRINPGTQVRWPVSCTTGTVYAPVTNTCVATPAGATGAMDGFTVPGQLTVGGVGYQSPESALQAHQIQRAAAQDYASNTTTTFTDGTCYPWAASTYNNVYISDFSLHVLRRPESTTTACIRNILAKFLAKVSTSSTPAPSTYGGGLGNVPAANGSIPIALLQNGMPVAYCSAWDAVCEYATGDGWIFATLLEGEYYTLSGDTSEFLADAPALETALAAVPTDPTTGIPSITKYVPGSTPLGSEWVGWAFMEKMRLTGLVTNVAAWYYADALSMARLYGVVGNTASQARWTAIAAKVQGNMGTASALWNAALGVYNAATGQNAQPDNMGTALACHYGLATSAQCLAFSAYLNTNYSTLFYYGYTRQSNANWGTVGYITSTGTYSATDPDSQPGCYQDGYWSAANLEIAEAVNLTNPSNAAQLLGQFTTGPDPTMEFWSVPTTTCARMNGGTNNLESPAGMAAFAASHPGLVALESFTQLHALVGGGWYTADSTIAGPSVQISGTVTNNATYLATRFNNAVNAGFCVSTGKVEALPNQGFCFGLLSGSSNFSLWSRLLGTSSPSIVVNPVTGAVAVGSLGAATGSFGGVAGITLLYQNALYDVTGEHLINTALPGAKLALLGNGNLLLQTAPATSGNPSWTTVTTIQGTSGNPISTTGYAVTAPLGTLVPGACTPNGYVNTTINGTSYHVATCP